LERDPRWRRGRPISQGGHRRSRCKWSFGEEPRGSRNRDEGVTYESVVGELRSHVDPDRYGDLTDEFEQMYSAEAFPGNGSVIMCGDIDDLLIEMVRYLVTRN